MKTTSTCTTQAGNARTGNVEMKMQHQMSRLENAGLEKASTIKYGKSDRSLR